MPFVIVEHQEERIIEVIYPEKPTANDVTAYMAQIRKVMDRQIDIWSCLTDQRKLMVMSPELLEEVVALQAYAERRGMQRVARVVASAIGSLQISRLMRSTSGRIVTRVFESRDLAFSWLCTHDSVPPPSASPPSSRRASSPPSSRRASSLPQPPQPKPRNK